MLDGPDRTPAALAQAWLKRLEAAARDGDDATLASLFHDACFWRDAVALTWDLRTMADPGPVAAALGPALRDAGASSFVLDPDQPAPAVVQRVDRDCIEAFFRFETRQGRALGVLRLVQDAPDAAWRGWTLLTALEELKGHEERAGARRPTGQSESRDFRGPNWLDQRRASQAFEGREPAVVVVGAGQAGLAVAARLGALGVDTLVVERNARVGDNWRHRYHALTLHNRVQVNHLPYMPFPETWPTYIAKDKLAGWLEYYAEAMEIDVWTGTELLHGTRDPEAGAWSLRLRRADGTERELRPRHVILATGVSGVPNRPELPGLEDFEGEVLHSSAYRDGDDWSGRRAMVIGSGNSGHDIAQDLWSAGAAVTMVQRSPTTVVGIEPAAQLPYAFYDEGPTARNDLVAMSMPVPLLRRAHVAYTRRAREIDRELLARLEARGFRLDFGEDGTGWQFKYQTRGGGYYFNVGCSDLIADGEIGLIQACELSGFGPKGARLAGGRELPLDLVVLSTGYKGQEHLVARLFGREVADRVGPVWGFGEGMELRNMFALTPQPGLWFIAGSLAQCRIYSRCLAQLVKAEEEGLAPGRPE